MAEAKETLEKEAVGRVELICKLQTQGILLVSSCLPPVRSDATATGLWWIKATGAILTRTSSSQSLLCLFQHFTYLKTFQCRKIAIPPL